MKKPQLSFEYFQEKKTKKKYGRTIHGGSATKGKRKEFRPLSTKNAIHLVLKSDKAKKKLSFLTYENKPIVESIVRDKAKKFGIKLAEFANVGDHLHLKIRAPSRLAFQKFLKSITTLIARKITGARKGHKFGRFWQGLAFTRVLKSAFEELQLRGYIEANRVQVREGYDRREEYRKTYNEWVYALRTDSD